jgi:hypothetical protein
MANITDWRLANDSPCWLQPRRHIYFLTRTVNGRREDMLTPSGRLRTWETSDAANKFLRTITRREA